MTWTLSRKQLALVTAYAAFFPAATLVGKPVAELALFCSFPFLPVAYPLAAITAYPLAHIGFPGEVAWGIGTFLAIFLQVWVVTVSWQASRAKRKRMGAAAPTDRAAEPAPRWWWALIAGAWFVVLSQVAIWMMDITLIGPERPLHTFQTAPIISVSIGLAAFLAGAACWWASLHRKIPLLATAASFGLGTAVLTMLVNPYGWALLLPLPGFVYPVVLVSLFIVGGLAIKLVFVLCARVWP